MYRVRQRGFTLMELMTVILIIGILSALAVPEISEAMANRRMHDGAVRVMGVYRVARARALGRGLAQMVRYVGAGSRLEHWEGNTNGCSSSDWANIVLTRGNVPTFLDRLVDELDFTISPYVNNGIRLDRFSLVGGLAGGSVSAQPDLCFTPLGRVFFRPDPMTAWTEAPGGATGGYQLRITRNLVGERGVRRYVVIPSSGTPRLQVQRVP